MQTAGTGWSPIVITVPYVGTATASSTNLTINLTNNLTFAGGTIPTSLTITRFKNDDMIRQLFLDKVSYNQDLPQDFWSVDAAEHRIKK